MAASRLYATAAAVAATFACAVPAAHAQSNVVSTVAGNGVQGFGGDGGTALSAQLSNPIGVSVASGGGYLIADQGNGRVRRVAADGTITTVAGSGTTGFGGDGGPATSAALSTAVNGIAQTAGGGVLVSDSNNNRVRFVAPDGTITTVAGGGGTLGDGGPATSALLAFPADVAVQADGGYLIADNDNHRIRRVAPDGTITTVAGTGSAAFGGDGGPATSAQINDPTGVAVTPDGGFLIADLNNNRVRRVAADGTITTVAGSGTPGFAGDGGPATTAALNAPNGVAAAPDGGFAIADRSNNRVRYVSPGGTINTIVGTGTAGYNGDGALGTATALNGPFDVTRTAEGDYLIADTSNHRIRLLDAAAPLPQPPPPVPRPSSLVLDPAQADRRPGDANVVIATVRNDDGSVGANRAIRFAIGGPNDGAGTATTDASGAARITWQGVREGTDTLTAYVDTDGNGTPDAGEPTATATVKWTLPVPVQGRTVNIEPISGIVRIRVIRRGRVGAAGSSAVSGVLTEARQLPLATIVDTRRGRVRVTSLANNRGATQNSQFYGGVFSTVQSRRGTRPVTEVRLRETLTCRSGSGKVTAGRARSRRLWGNGRGRFRTRGRNSTATVRGTIWLQKDTCKATTTTVREGTVTVRDFARRRNVRVRAGRSYVARPRRR